MVSGSADLAAARGTRVTDAADLLAGEKAWDEFS
jgi:hypothetical protein